MSELRSEEATSPPAATTSPLVLILNPTAGKGRAARELVNLRTLIARRGIRADIFLTRREGDAAAMVKDLAIPDDAIVVAAGGDGTVHEVGTALLDRPGLSLGVLPLGSGNDYAGLMGMPNDPLLALETILDGEDRHWDAGTVGPFFFLNSVGFALSASVSSHSRNTGPLRGMARYGLAIVRAFVRHRPLLIGLDGLQESGNHRITLMEIGIGDRCGGGFRLTHRADPADGLLDACIVRHMPRWKIPLLLPRGLRGHHIGHPLVIYEQVSSFRLKLENDTMIHVDGEIRILERGEHSIRVRPRALRVRVPRGWTLPRTAKASS